MRRFPSGIAIAVAAGAIAFASHKALVASMPLGRGIGSTNIVVMSLDRDDIDRVLERRRLASLEISNELDRQARGMSALPTARIEKHD